MFITRKQIQSNPNILFVFGDNDQRKGLGGMAKEFRGENNSFGIRTKKKPSNSRNSFYTDMEYSENCEKIKEDLIFIYNTMKNFIGIYIPEGIGTGFSKLDIRAPMTYKFLKEQLEQIKKDFSK